MSLLARRLLVLLLGLLLATAAVGRKKDVDEVDYLELAAVLVQDGNYDRAEQALLNIPDPQGEDVDTPRFHSVYGLIHLNRNAYELAKRSFYAAIDAGLVDELTGETPEVIYVYLAQVHFGLEEYDQAIEALDKAGSTAARLSSTWVLRAHAHWLMERRQRTFDVLTEASARFPGNYSFMRREIFYLIELELYQEAAELGRRYLDLTEGSVEDYVAIGNALRQAGQYRQALRFLETAALLFPEDTDVARVLAHTHFESGNTLAAAEIFYRASLSEPELVSEAAELYRRSGKLYRALSLNGQIRDPEKKLKQRLAIYLGLERYEEITAMEPAMYRAGLLEDEDLRYALAYAWFQVGDYDRAENHLARLTRPELFRKAVELRRAMEDCVAEPWRCS